MDAVRFVGQALAHSARRGAAGSKCAAGESRSEEGGALAGGARLAPAPADRHANRESSAQAGLADLRMTPATLATLRHSPPQSLGCLSRMSRLSQGAGTILSFEKDRLP